KAVAGIAMGLIMEGDQAAILSDILGDEDHLGDMDFKVTGSSEGVIALQMDIKVGGVPKDVMRQALYQAKEGRLFILEEMNKTISGPRQELSPFAPRVVSIEIHPDNSRDIIGPGGKVIRQIVAETNTKIDVEDDGKVTIMSPDLAGCNMAVEMIEKLTAEAEVGSLYMGRVRKITDFGAFVEILPGTDGLVHISDMSWTRRINHPSEVVQKGQDVNAVVTAVDVSNQRISLSMKELLPNEWEEYANSHGVGNQVAGKVTNITDFGVFIELAPGVEGLCHISELDRPEGQSLEEIFTAGQKVMCRILRIDWNESRIGLSMQSVAQDSSDEAFEETGDGALGDTAMAAALRAGGILAEDEIEKATAEVAPSDEGDAVAEVAEAPTEEEAAEEASEPVEEAEPEAAVEAAPEAEEALAAESAVEEEPEVDAEPVAEATPEVEAAPQTEESSEVEAVVAEDPVVEAEEPDAKAEDSEETEEKPGE
ncbi:MAG: S1 RNA-binding domain-containing protein, partial [Acidobacteriota bacterium]